MDLLFFWIGARIPRLMVIALGAGRNKVERENTEVLVVCFLQMMIKVSNFPETAVRTDGDR